MIKIYIFADSYKHFEAPIKEYEKRLWKDLKITKLKPSKKKEDFLVIKEETDIVLDKLTSEKWYKIVLSPSWKVFSTDQILSSVKYIKMNHSVASIFIWWAFGFDYERLKWKIDLELALWTLTMPHSLALLVILEQIYRAGMIEKWTSYHK